MKTRRLLILALLCLALIASSPGPIIPTCLACRQAYCLYMPFIP